MRTVPADWLKSHFYSLHDPRGACRLVVMPKVDEADYRAALNAHAVANWHIRGVAAVEDHIHIYHQEYT